VLRESHSPPHGCTPFDSSGNVSTSRSSALLLFVTGGMTRRLPPPPNLNLRPPQTPPHLEVSVFCFFTCAISSFCCFCQGKLCVTVDSAFGLFPFLVQFTHLPSISSPPTRIPQPVLTRQWEMCTNLNIPLVVLHRQGPRPSCTLPVLKPRLPPPDSHPHHLHHKRTLPSLRNSLTVDTTMLTVSPLLIDFPPVLPDPLLSHPPPKKHFFPICCDLFLVFGGCVAFV